MSWTTRRRERRRWENKRSRSITKQKQAAIAPGGRANGSWPGMSLNPTRQNRDAHRNARYGACGTRHFAPQHLQRRAARALPAERGRLSGIPRRRRRARSVARRPSEGFRHRDQRDAGGGPQPVPQLPPDRTALSPRACRVRPRDRRGRDVPRHQRRRQQAIAISSMAASCATTSTARSRRMRCAATSRSTRSTTTSPISACAITSAAWRISMRTRCA